MSLTAIAFALAFLAGCVLAFARHPIFGLVTYVFVFYLHPPSRWWGQGLLLDVRWSLLAALVTMVAVLLKDREGKRPRMPQRVVVAVTLFTAWLALQLMWAMDRNLQFELIALYAKYALLVWLIFRCIETTQHLRAFLWAHVIGCFYLGTIVFASYGGGRFEGFGGPGIDDANSGAMQIVTGILSASALFLASKGRERFVLLMMIPFIVNALVAAISRSAALAAAVGGVAFNIMTPHRFRWFVRALSVLAIGLFLMLTNEVFWERMQTLKHRGEYVEGQDTGWSRVVIIQAQWQMFEAHPMGCGHRCTAILSPSYLSDEYLTGPEGRRGRSSHNSFMTMLVEHGVLGALFYVAALVWLVRTSLRLRRRLYLDDGTLGHVLPGVVSVLAAITIGDMFVDYVKLEVRFWFIAILLVMLHMTTSAPIAAVLPDRKYALPEGSQR